MTTVEINGEALKVKVTAPGAGLAEATEAALKLHRRVCAGIAQRERHEKRVTVMRLVSGGHAFGFKPEEAPEEPAEEPAEDDDDEE